VEYDEEDGALGMPQPDFTGHFFSHSAMTDTFAHYGPVTHGFAFNLRNSATNRSWMDPFE
jgi:hypothetical protein